MQRFKGNAAMHFGMKRVKCELGKLSEIPNWYFQNGSPYIHCNECANCGIVFSKVQIRKIIYGGLPRPYWIRVANVTGFCFQPVPTQIRRATLKVLLFTQQAAAIAVSC